PGRARLHARHPLGRAGADAVLRHALPERWAALDAADHAARLWRPAVAAAAGLCAGIRCVRHAGDGRWRPGPGIVDHDVGAGAGIRGIPGTRKTVRVAAP